MIKDKKNRKDNKTSNKKINFNSFGIKLWSWFILFAAGIFIVLWLLQTVFLQTFYNNMAISNIKKNAQIITKKFNEKKENNENSLENIIDEVAKKIDF